MSASLYINKAHISYINKTHDVIIDNVMINHLTCFLNKCVLSFKRDNHLETLSSVKQKTPRPSALVFSVSRMTSFSMIIPYEAVCNTSQL